MPNIHDITRVPLLHLHIQCCQDRGFHLHSRTPPDLFSPGSDIKHFIPVPAWQEQMNSCYAGGSERSQLPAFLTRTSILQQSQEGEEEQNLTKMMVFNGNQRYGYNYRVQHKNPWVIQQLEGYKVTRVTLGTEEKPLQNLGVRLVRLVRPLPAILSVLTPGKKKKSKMSISSECSASPSTPPTHPNDQVAGMYR